MIGDGSLLYNPIIQGLGASAQHKLPLLIVVFNNKKYASMKANHVRYYPDGVAVTTNVFHGVELDPPDFAKLTAHFGGTGKTVTDPGDLAAALREGLATVAKGETAIINVMLTQ
jgi:acetolactate synthase-1/2/3 large subunit